MLKKVLLASALGAALFTTSLAQSAVAAEAAAAKAPTIAVLNLQYIMTEIPQSKALQQTLAKEFG